jgi:hypothetical protein
MPETNEKITEETTSVETEVTKTPEAKTEATDGTIGTESTTSENTKESTTEASESVETKSAESDSEPAQTTAESEQTPPERVVPAPDQYVLPEGAPVGLGQFAHDNDMTQEQLDATLNTYKTMMDTNKAYQDKTIREAGEAHVEAWGDQKKYNLSLVHRAVEQNDPDGQLTELLNSTGYGNHPVILDFFLKIGNSMKEGGFLRGSVNVPQGKKTAAQALFGNNHPSNNN